MKNRRRAPRREVNWSVFDDALPESQRSADAWIRDISSGGMFVETPEDMSDLIEPGDKVRLCYTDEGDSVEVLARIRWCGFSTTHDCPGVGLELEPQTPPPEPPRAA